MTSLKFLTSLALLLVCLPSQAAVHTWLYDNTFNLDKAVLSQFYAPKASYTWMKDGKETQQSIDALNFISTASQHGLNPTDYHYPTLKELTPSRDKLTAQKFDILLTDGLIKLIHDLSVGRLQADQVDPDWYIPQASFDAAGFLKNALLNEELSSSLETSYPNSTVYIKTMEILSRYQNYVDQGGWGELPLFPTLRPGDSHDVIPKIKARLAFEYDYYFESEDLIFSPLMVEAIRQFQKYHGLKEDGIIGPGTLYAMNISAEDRVQQIKIALERRRWLPRELGQRHLFINLASYQLRAMEDGEEKLSMRIIAGRKSRQTPSFTSKMNRFVANPYWNVPRKLAVRDLLPKQQDNFNYFTQHNIQVFSRENGQKIVQDPYIIDWDSLNTNNFPYSLRQEPGNQNALGRMKFLFPNKWAIYLHDTNHRSLFRKTMRSLSSGCIRVEKPIELANFSLAGTLKPQRIIDMIDSKKNRGRVIAEPLPIYAVYLTVWLDDNEIILSPDVYQRDNRMGNSL